MTAGVGGSTFEHELARMAPMVADAQPIPVEELHARVGKAQRLMREAGVHALYLDTSTNLRYFTGVALHLTERLHGAVIPAEGEVAYLSPAFEEPKTRALLRFGADIRTWEEHEDPTALVIDTVRSMGHAGGTLAIDPLTPFFTVDGLRRAGNSFSLANAAPITAACRMVKSAHEIALMQAANDITLAVQAAAARALAPGMVTTEVAAFLDAAHRALGGQPGSRAVQFGEATAYPHGVPYPQTLQEGDMVLIDTGCFVHGYRSDITRSYVFGDPTPRQREIWELERRAQQAGFDAAQPGAPCEAVDAAARRTIHLGGFGPDYATPGLPHRTGHGIGMDVHEPPFLMQAATRTVHAARHVLLGRADDLHLRRVRRPAGGHRIRHRGRPALVHPALPVGGRPVPHPGGPAMTAILFTNGHVLDPRWDGPRGGMEVLVEGTAIREISDRPIHSAAAARVDLGGRVLMPGLIDAHVHVVAAMADLAANAAQPSSLAALRAGRIMEAMLRRGFTTVRDVGGADRGLAEAQATGVVPGPRLVISGKALSQTGGHCDSRTRSDDRAWYQHRVGAMGRLCDGVEAVRLAAREELRAGADFIKVMANGGIASPTDPIHMLQYSADELRAAVEEASNLGTYVSAHLYTDAAIRRAVECGIHSLEHCNLIAAATAAQAAAAGCVAVPTLITYERLAVEGAQLGLRPDSVAKIETVRQAGLASLDVMRSAGLPMAYGSDLLGEMHQHQSGEFALRARVLPALEVLRSATTLAARLCGLEGRAGIVEPGADADLLVVDGNPLEDWGLLEGQGARIPVIMQAGRFVKRELA